MFDFERCHGNGEAYKKYKSIKSKFTDEFIGLTREIMIETYIREQMNRPGLYTDRDYVNLKNTWRSVANELGVLYEYPYSMDTFIPGHPDAALVARVAKCRLGID